MRIVNKLSQNFSSHELHFSKNISSDNVWDENQVDISKIIMNLFYLRVCLPRKIVQVAQQLISIFVPDFCKTRDIERGKVDDWVLLLAYMKLNNFGAAMQDVVEAY